MDAGAVAPAFIGLHIGDGIGDNSPGDPLESVHGGKFLGAAQPTTEPNELSPI
jgi:hypothetical protein